MTILDCHLVRLLGLIHAAENERLLSVPVVLKDSILRAQIMTAADKLKTSETAEPVSRRAFCGSNNKTGPVRRAH